MPWHFTTVCRTYSRNLSERLEDHRIIGGSFSMRLISIVFSIAILLCSCAGRVLTSETGNDPSESASGTAVASGEFQGYGHLGAGEAQLVEGESGGSVLLTNFQTTPGPDLYVYLATGIDAVDFVDLGELAQPTGDQSYPLSEPVDIDNYPFVLIWCKSFGVLFAAAELE